MDAPSLGVQSELQPLAYATATATSTQNPSRICDLYYSSRQRWILNPLSEARDRICIVMDTSRVHYHWATTGTPSLSLKSTPSLISLLPLPSSGPQHHSPERWQQPPTWSLWFPFIPHIAEIFLKCKWDQITPVLFKHFSNFPLDSLWSPDA